MVLYLWRKGVLDSGTECPGGLGTCVARSGSQGRRNRTPHVEYSANHVIWNYLCGLLQVQERQVLVQEQSSPNKSTPTPELRKTGCKVAHGWHVCQPHVHAPSTPQTSQLEYKKPACLMPNISSRIAWATIFCTSHYHVYC
jgi:hypothetical protein